ncbi:MAG TPA: alanine racemase [Chitinispirillaceae bacterium]|nr:alanine racemase [Chitinispirillaceae bacterium]
MQTNDPTVIEISLDNLLYNVDNIKQSIPPDLKIIAVVKDNAYGCGATPVASFLEKFHKVDMFTVARIEEAAQLRNNGISLPILILGKTSPELISESTGKNFIYTLNEVNDCYLWSKLNTPVEFHINIDTGMTRMGILPHEIHNVLCALKETTNLHCKGMYTHFTSADVPGTPTVAQQLSIFNHALSTLKTNGIHPEVIHTSNSAGLSRFTPEGCTHVRPGIMLYGCKPDPAQEFPIPLKPIMTLKSNVVRLKQVPEGTKVSYGGNYSTPSETWIAVIPAGYGQGIPRFLSSCGEVLIRGRRYRIAGNVTMDYIMVDAGPQPEIALGDEVIIIGVQGHDKITPDEIAIKGNTIGYEIICNLGKSIRRIYRHNGSITCEIPGTIF